MQHVLSLEAPDTLNVCIIRLIDTSIYSGINAPTCPELLVTVPGFTDPVNVPIQPGFILNLTACDLKIQTTNCGTTYFDLPDGIYVLRYSVSPNQYVYVEYNHLRITKALLRIRQILCSLDIANCDPPEKTKQKVQELGLIRMYLLAAKAKVEDCRKPAAGMEIYNYAVKLLGKITCSNCI